MTFVFTEQANMKKMINVLNLWSKIAAVGLTVFWCKLLIVNFLSFLISQ